MADQRGIGTQDRVIKSVHGVTLSQPGGEPMLMMKSLLSLDWRRVIIVALIAALFGFLGTYGIGRVGDASGAELLRSIKPTTRFLCFAAISAPATILALMMTVLSFSGGWNPGFLPEYYDKIRQVALLCALALVAGVFLLLFLNVPLLESETFEAWYQILYHAILIYGSLLGGMLVAIIFLLYNVVTILIAAVDPHVDASAVFDSEESAGNAGT